MSKSKKTAPKSNKSYNSLIIVGILLLIAFMGYRYMAPKEAAEQTGTNTSLSEAIVEGKELKIKKADITSQAKFYSYKEAGTYMEVLAVKASDGSIRTALNTCQVCFDSGKGYYEQVGDTLVCQNCGNVFGVDDIEVVKGGCNPVPIVSDFKTEDDEFITISGDYLADNTGYFEKWRR